VLRIFLRAVQTTIRTASPTAPPKARFGAVSFIHRAGSTFNEHLHFHCLVTDGLFAPAENGGAEFFEAAGIDEARIDRLTDTLRRRILRYMVRRDLIDDHVALDMAGWDHHGGFSLDAAVRVEAWDRMALERLARYCARPPFAEGRLALADPNTVVYSLKKPDPRGRNSLTLTPLELIRLLAALIPPPRVHRHRYAGVLAPNSPLRQQVIASAGLAGVLADRLAEAARSMGLGGQDQPGVEAANPGTDEPKPSPRSRASRLSWAMLIARIYEAALPLLCPHCASPMRIVACITQPVVIDRILTHLGQPVEPPPIIPAREVPLRLPNTAPGRGPPPANDEWASHNTDW